MSALERLLGEGLSTQRERKLERICMELKQRLEDIKKHQAICIKGEVRLSTTWCIADLGLGRAEQIAGEE